ncbi:MAG TPA: putative metal-dependent hydrolase [Gemmatimonadaceae bacterium]
MTEAGVEQLRFPVGRFVFPPSLDAAGRERAITAIERLPTELAAALGNAREAAFESRYREGGWTVRQVVHHLADSHINAYVRMRLTLTEDHPTIKTYEEARWAELGDTALPPQVSVRLLEPLHQRWVALLRSIPAADFARTLNHPEHGPMRLDQLLAMYAWHGEHHVAHVRIALR